jgi:hypothetical protein
MISVFREDWIFAVISNKMGIAGLIAGAALALSAVGNATAADNPSAGFTEHYPTYLACMTDGNIFAQRGLLHGFHCDHVQDLAGKSYWHLVATS